MGFKTVPLRDLCNSYKDDIVDGPFGANLKREHYKEDGIPVLKIQNIKPFKITLKKMDYVDEAKYLELIRHSYTAGDIVMTKLGDPLGESAIIDGVEDGLIVADLVRIRAQKIETKYLCYHLNSPVTKTFINSQQKGTTRPRIRLSVVRDLPIYAPAVSEQKRIVAILDRAFEEINYARSSTEKNLKNVRDVFDSYLQQVFNQGGEGWGEKGLVDISLDFGRGRSRHRPRNDESLYGGIYPFIQTGDVRNCEQVITEFSKTYNEKGLAQSKLWPEGTICITIAANIAETGILGFDGCFPDSVIGIVVNPKVTTVKYVEYLLQSFKAILKSQGKGSAQDNINMGTFENMKFPFPSLQKQKEIVGVLDVLLTSVHQLERIYINKLKCIDELKSALLQKAFTGELRKNKVQ